MTEKKCTEGHRSGSFDSISYEALQPFISAWWNALTKEQKDAICLSGQNAGYTGVYASDYYCNEFYDNLNFGTKGYLDVYFRKNVLPEKPQAVKKALEFHNQLEKIKIKKKAEDSLEREGMRKGILELLKVKDSLVIQLEKIANMSAYGAISVDKYLQNLNDSAKDLVDSLEKKNELRDMYYPRLYLVKLNDAIQETSKFLGNVDEKRILAVDNWAKEYVKNVGKR